MSRPVIGVSGNHHLANDAYEVQAAGARNIEAVSEAAECLPLVIPALPDTQDIGELLEHCDGFLLTGGRPNVHPSLYGHEETEAHGPFDPGRDGVMLPLLKAAIDAGLPVFGVCRGIQEMNVAYGGTLHPEIRDLPGRENHRMPPGETDPEIIFRMRHKVRLVPGGEFSRMLGTEEIETNSLHGQGLIDLGERIRLEGTAPDGTIEAVSVEGARRFALGVQWHAEWAATADPVSKVLFNAFGEAARAVRAEKSARRAA